MTDCCFYDKIQVNNVPVPNSTVFQLDIQDIELTFFCTSKYNILYSDLIQF